MTGSFREKDQCFVVIVAPLPTFLLTPQFLTVAYATPPKVAT